MKEVNERKYVSYTIVGCGWQFNVYSWQKAKAEWHNMKYGILYGNKADGTRETINEK